MRQTSKAGRAAERAYVGRRSGASFEAGALALSEMFE